MFRFNFFCFVISAETQMIATFVKIFSEKTAEKFGGMKQNT